MADKELKFKVTTEVDTSGLEDIENALNNLEDKTITIRPEIEAMELEEVENRIEELEDKRAEIYMGVDDTPLEEVEAELEELEARQIELTIEADSSSVDDASGKIEELDGKEVNIPVNADTSGAEDSINSLEEALTAVSAGAALAGMEQMVSTAGNIQDSWNRLGLTFGEVTEQMKTDISEAGAATGRSGGLIRQYFNDMGVAGVTNTELLQQSFEALSGRAYQTGNSIESMEQKMKMMVMSGNAGARQLTQLGISTADLGRVMGVSADEASKMFKTLSQEERLRVLTQAMGDGKQANEEYKNSWQGLKNQAGKAMDALMGAVGSAILPVLVPVMKFAADTINFLADAFKKLPEPIRGAIGVLGALVMGFLAYQVVMSGLKALNIAETFMGLVDALRSVTMAQLASNAAALTNPYVLIAVAVIALIGALWYLYNTNEAVKQAFDHVGQALGQLCDKLTTALKPAIDAIIDAWNGLMEALGIDGGDIFNSIIFFIVAFAEGLVLIINGITEFIGWLQQLWMVSNQLINGTDWLGWLQVLGLVLTGPIGWIVLLIQHWNQIGPAVNNALSGMYNAAVGWFAKTVAGIIAFGVNLVKEMKSKAKEAVDGFLAPLRGLAESVGAELAAVKATVMQYIQPIIDAFNSLGSAASWAFSVLGLGQHSPGDIYKAMKSELEWTTDFVKGDKTGLASATAGLGSDVVSNFNPNFNLGSGSGSGTQAVGGVTMNITINGDVDSDERMEKFADYIITRINWDNTTAGRTV